MDRSQIELPHHFHDREMAKNESIPNRAVCFYGPVSMVYLMCKSINFGTFRGKPSDYDNILTLLSHGSYDICEIIIMARAGTGTWDRPGSTGICMYVFVSFLMIKSDVFVSALKIDRYNKNEG